MEKINNYTYRIEKTVLGKGAFGTIYLGTIIEKDEEIALKELPSEIDKETLDIVSNEIKINTNLDNTNIVKMIDIAVINEKKYLVFELCNGGDLRKYMNYFGKFDEELVRIITIKLINGLYELKKKEVIHHDIKPEHILIQLFYEQKKTPELEKEINDIKSFIKKKEVRDNNNSQQNDNLYNMNNMNNMNNLNKMNNFINNNNMNNNNNIMMNPVNNNNLINNNIIANNNNSNEEMEKKIIKVLKEAQYKLSDFRLSKLRGEIITKNLAGSPLYMAPELFNPSVSIESIENFQVDIWALGVMVFEMFYGRKPFEAFSIDQLSSMYIKGEFYININREITKEFLNFINMCLQKDPTKRADIKKLRNSCFINMSEEEAIKLNKDEIIELFKDKAKVDENNPDHLILNINKNYFEDEDKN